VNLLIKGSDNERKTLKNVNRVGEEEKKRKLERTVRKKNAEHVELSRKGGDSHQLLTFNKRLAIDRTRINPLKKETLNRD